MKTICLEPIGFVRNVRLTPEDDNWGSIVSIIELAPHIEPEALLGLDTFSHAEIIFYFDQVKEDKIVTGARHPRNNPDWLKIGIFAQRGKNRPNRLGLATVKVIKLEGRELHIGNLDAINGTPVLDIKPVMQEFEPTGHIRQPDWSHQLMKNYW
ncbi:MAG: SAM-dependent methyltransferase [Anaerolineales bacterium]|nr:SAM-dependent methyltransferase [Anaerolineales bacterium]